MQTNGFKISALVLAQIFTLFALPIFAIAADMAEGQPDDIVLKFSEPQSNLTFPKVLVMPSAKTATKLVFPSMTCLGEGLNKCTKLELTAYMFLPIAATNRMVIISHGSQGVDARHFEYADSLTKAGMAAIVMDHWTPRGFGKVHHDFLANAAKGGNTDSMATDVLMAVDYLKKTYPDFTKFGFIGESMGGSTAMVLDRNAFYRHVQYHAGAIVPSLDAIVALYAGCSYRSHDFGTRRIPFLFISGEKDGNTPAVQCVKYSDWMNQRGGNFKIVILSGEEHDFDAPYPRGYFPNPQHYAECAVYAERDTITFEKTGEKFPNTPIAYQDLMKRCLKRGTYGGYTKDRFVGVPYWIEHFKKNL